MKNDKVDVVLNKLDGHDQKFDRIDSRLNEIMTGLDKVMDELLKAREDRTMAIGKDREQDRRLDKIEAKIGI